jgi:formate hydrogenlyase transcriptional activator
LSAHTSPSNDDAASRRYRSLLEVTESISSHTDISELFKELPAHLRPVVNFDAVAVALHDDEHDIMRLHVFESSLPLQHQPLKGEGGPVSLSPEGVVWQTQQPMLISPVVGETRFPAYIARLRAENINTLYSIPLTSLGRRLGAIAFGGVRENAYDESELEFLRQVAKQVAVAVDNVLNFQQAVSERDRKQLLIEVGEAVVSILSLSDLFRAVSSCLRRFINHDTASFVLQDQDTGELRVHMLDRAPGGILGEGMVIPMDGTPAGLCIKTRSTILRDRIDFEEFYVPQMRTAYALGLRCGCSVPLIAQGQVLGADRPASCRGNAERAEFPQSGTRARSQPVTTRYQQCGRYQSRTA